MAAAALRGLIVGPSDSSLTCHDRSRRADDTLHATFFMDCKRAGVSVRRRGAPPRHSPSQPHVVHDCPNRERMSRIKQRGVRKVHLEFPKPSGWADLENLTTMLLEGGYRATNVQRYGRQGQAQNGVDVLASEWGPNNGQIHVGYQCKAVRALTQKEVEAECALAKGFKPAIDRYVIVTTLSRDANLQTSVKGIDSGTYGFPVDIWFWDDLNEKLNRTAEAAQAYFANITVEAQPAKAAAHVAALRRALDRPAFKDSIHAERSVDELVEALARTSAFMRTGYLHDNLNNFVESTVPPHKIGEKGYSAFCFAFIKELDALYNCALENRLELQDTSTSSGAAAAIKFMGLRSAVLQRANKEFKKYQLAEIPIRI
jgi:hypothetical protein